MNAVVVTTAGFLTTVQDLGRPGHAAAGVSASGAADPLALRIGNRLTGNDDSAPALELTLVGGAFRFEGDGLFALAGGDAQARLEDRAVAPWRPSPVRAGETLVCRALQRGARAYLCVRGGFEVPRLFGSASTHLSTGLGGYQGRVLSVGDRLLVGASAPRPPFGRAVDPFTIPGYRSGDPFRVTEGPQASWFAPEVRARLYETAWRVSPACDRMGIRLSGGALALAVARELVTEGVCLGAVQVPPGGEPIVLFVEHQTTGGYPKIANVIAADLARLGSLRAGDPVRFARVTTVEARTLLRAQEEAIDALFD